MARTVVPERIRRSDEALEVTWSADHVGRFPARPLRLACPCAACVDEMTGWPLLDPVSVPRDVKPLAVEAVGGYAIRVRWSDGHSSGMQTFEWLLSHCPCDACAAARGEHLAGPDTDATV